MAHFFKNNSQLILSKNHASNYAGNMIVVGGPGFGKTRGFVIPNILEGYASYVVYDKLLEVYRATRDTLVSMGYEVKVCDFDNGDNSELDVVALCEELSTKKVAVFIKAGCSYDETSMKRKGSFIESVMEHLYDCCKKQHETKQLDVPVAFFFDEFCSMPSLSALDKRLLEFQPYNVSFNIMCMNFSQLKLYFEKCCDYKGESLIGQIEGVLQVGPHSICDYSYGYDIKSDIQRNQVCFGSRAGYFVDDIYELD